DRDLAGQIAFGDGGGDVGDVTDLAGEVGGHGIDVVGQIFPGAGDTGHEGLAVEFAVGTDLAGDAGVFRGIAVELVDRCHDGVLAGQVAFGDGGGDVGDVADLAGEVGGHGIDVVGQIFPGAGDTGHEGLAAEFTFGTDFARDAGDFRCKAVELVDHCINGVLELEDFAFDVDGDLAGQVAFGHGGRHFGDRS